GGRLLVRWRWFVLAAAAGVMLFGATWGTGVFPYLTGGGFVDPASESSRAAERIRAELGDQDTHLIVLYRSDTETVDAPTFAEAVTDRAAALRASPAVISVVSWYDTGAPHLVATDRHATYLAVKLAGEDEDELVDSYHQIRELTPAAGVTTEGGGWVAFLDDANQQTERDVVRAEVVSFPLLLVLLILIFRGVVAALAPLLIGGLAILGAFITTLILAQLSEVSVFAVNTITVIGLAMAIDYALFIVSRFREELDRGRAVDEAIRHTLATAGRTVFVSGLTIMLALASLLIFPQSFLRSMALGGISAVGVAMLGSLTVLPATLAALGHRINAGRVRLPFRRRANQHDDHEGAWARLARSVMRRPVVYLRAVIAV